MKKIAGERHAGGVSPAAVNQVVQAIRFREKLHAAGVSIVGPITSRTLAGIRREGSGPRPRPNRRDPLG